MTRTLIIEADGGSRGNPGPSGYGALVTDGDTGEILAERAGFLGHTTNNVAEYRGLIAGLHAARGIDTAARWQVRLDSNLIVQQMTGAWKVKNANMKVLHATARDLIEGVDVDFSWQPRAKNSAADALANEAMDTQHASIRRGHGADGSDPEDMSALF